MSEDGATKKLGSVTARMVRILAVGFSVFNLYQAAFGVWEAYLSRALHLFWGLVLIYLVYPTLKDSPQNRFSQCVDISLTVLSCAVGIYTVVNYEALIQMSGYATNEALILGGGVLVLTLEATRRTVGLPLVVLTLLFIVYTIYGIYFPGVLIHSGFSLGEMIETNYLSTDGLFGVPLGAFTNYIFIFMIFAAFLEKSGVSNFFMDFANSLMGHRSGGAAKVSVVSSGFMGMISGSAVANVMTTGSFTIPTMKKTGYPPHIAGAIEAASSTGGQIMPPVMAAAGFLIAVFVGVPYFKVALAAFFPAVLYFFGVGVSVHLLATKYGLSGFPKESLPKLTRVLTGQGPLIIPIVAITLLLYWGYSPMYSAFYTILCSIGIAGFYRLLHRSDFSFSHILNALEISGLQVLQLVATCACAGILVSGIIMSGFSMKVGYLIKYLSGGSLLLALGLTAIFAIILGMGMTTTAAYIICATLLGPVLIDFNINPILAHLFILYFSVVNNVTPPVALAAYAGATVAGSDLWKTSWAAFKMAVPAFLVPFFFIYNPSLSLQGGSGRFVFEFLCCMIAVAGIGVATWGYYRKKLNYPMRMILFGLAIASGSKLLLVQIPTALSLVSFFYFLRKMEKKQKNIILSPNKADK
jgi:TRAP transporter 4TM/12TM fusion protein